MSKGKIGNNWQNRS